MLHTLFRSFHVGVGRVLDGIAARALEHGVQLWHNVLAFGDHDVALSVVCERAVGAVDRGRLGIDVVEYGRAGLDVCL